MMSKEDASESPALEKGACAVCGAVIPQGAANGTCPACLIEQCCFGDEEDDEETLVYSDTLATKVDPPPAEVRSEIGEKIGRYHLRHPLGQGGMGVVYLAEQREPVVRKVALKVIKLGMDTQQVVARFESERQALALMNHPGIAQVLDAGTTDTGRPYFVMELVEGAPVTNFCEDKKLSLSKRLELFIAICEAVQHAHQKGIVHRDLKPSNILVNRQDEKLVVKVIDFGIAKAVAPELNEVSLLETLGDHLIGTPAYMSPEQAAKGTIDTRSDIYSIGVMLYEVLTGGLPFAEKETPQHYEAYLRLVKETDPPRPSTWQSGRTTIPPKFLQHDLDWILLKALDREPDRRYASIGSLAQDLKRHLNHEPVSAGRPSRLYRAQKFARKHRFGLAAAAGMLLLLIGGVIVSTQQAYRAIKAERATAERLAGGEQLIRFMLDDLTREMKSLGKLEVLSNTAEEVTRFYEAIPVDQQSPESLKIRADALVNIARVRSSQGASEKAQAAFDHAKTLYEDLTQESNVSSEVYDGLASVLTLLGNHFEVLGKFDESESANAQALAIYQDLRAQEPDNTTWASGEAAAWLGQGIVLDRQGAYDLAEPALRKALLIWESLLRKTPEDSRLLQKVARAKQSLGISLRHLERLPEAETTLADALQDWKRLAERIPGDATILEGHAETLNNTAALAHAAGKTNRAVTLTKEAITLWRDLHTRDPSNVDWLYRLAVAEQNLGIAESRREDYLASAKAFEAALSSWSLLKTNEAPINRWRERRLQGLQAAEGVYRKLRAQALRTKSEQAILYANKTLQLDLTAWEEDPESMARRHHVAGTALDVVGTYGLLGQREGAIPAYKLARYLHHSNTSKDLDHLKRLEAMGKALGVQDDINSIPKLTALPTIPEFLQAEIKALSKANL